MSLTRWMHRGHKPKETEMTSSFLRAPGVKSEPMPDVRVTIHSLQDVQEALNRALNARTVNQMTDAMVSIDYFYNIVKQHHLSVINRMNKDQQGVYIPDQYELKEQEDKPNQDSIIT